MCEAQFPVAAARKRNSERYCHTVASKSEGIKAETCPNNKKTSTQIILDEERNALKKLFR
jgi:hypothetical protein